MDVNHSNKNGATALICAADEGHEKVVDLLLADLQVDVNSIDSYGQSALCYAVKKDHVGIMGKMLNHPDINLDTNENKSLLEDLAR